MMRSWLFSPANNEKLIEKALFSLADTVIFDLEDSVPPSDKEMARKCLVNLRERGMSGKKSLFLRVNSYDSPWFNEDIRIALSVGFDGVVLPKVSEMKQLMETISAIEHQEKEVKKKKKLMILPLVESAKGVLSAPAIASCSNRIIGLTFGMLDFLMEMEGRATVTEEETLFARSWIVLACRAANKSVVIDTIYPDFRDKDGFEKSVERAKNMGYTGKLLIHPIQIEKANEIFSYSEEELKYYREIVEVYEKAVENGIGAIQIEGKMIDIPIYESAKRILSNCNVQ